MLCVPVGLVLSGCADSSRLGMVVDPETGLQMGSRIERNIVVDPSQFENRRIKVNLRNTSGDAAFDLADVRSAIERRLAAKGYVPTRDDDFGILLDVNVHYSGQATQDRASAFGLLGAAGGGLAGYQASKGGVGTAAGVLAGATLGSILGSYVRDETYLVVADVSLGVVDPKRGYDTKTIVMDSSIDRRERDRAEVRRHSGMRAFGATAKTAVAV